MNTLDERCYGYEPAEIERLRNLLAEVSRDCFELRVEQHQGRSVLLHASSEVHAREKR